MASLLFKVRPPIAGTERLWVGSSRGLDGEGVYLGLLGEVTPGKPIHIWLSTRKEQVVAVVGKRGSGKSFTLGVIAEGLCVATPSPIATPRSADRAVLLFDPLDVYWTSRFPVFPSDNREAQQHFRLADARGLTGLEFSVNAWVPGAENRRPSDPAWFQFLQLPVPALGLEEWELFIGASTLSDPIGHALTDCLHLVREVGYMIQGKAVSPQAEFSIADLIHALGSTEMIPSYQGETLRALRQRLRALDRSGLFSATGTTLSDLLRPQAVTVILLGRLSQPHRSAVVTALTRLLMESRGHHSFSEKRLTLDPALTPEERVSIENDLIQGVPKTTVILDEAQTFLASGDAKATKRVFTRLAKEGRNIGLSFVIATQQPAAIDQRILSQVETFISHQLVTEADINAVKSNLKSSLPEKIEFGRQELSFGDCLRRLPPGQCFVSAADVSVAANRCFILNIRPRATVHGGIEL